MRKGKKYGNIFIFTKKCYVCRKGWAHESNTTTPCMSVVDRHIHCSCSCNKNRRKAK